MVCQGREVPAVAAAAELGCSAREVGGLMLARVATQICGTSNAWKVAELSDSPALVQERMVTLEIRGDRKDGYHLIMSPSGCFTADSWHSTIDDALDTAERLFDVRRDAWS
jgi:hypothetical protein